MSKLMLLLAVMFICLAQEFNSVQEFRSTAGSLRTRWEQFYLRPLELPFVPYNFHDVHHRFFRGAFMAVQNTESKNHQPVLFMKSLQQARLSYDSHEIITLFHNSFSPAFFNEWEGTYNGLLDFNGSDRSEIDKSVLFPLLKDTQIDVGSGDMHIHIDFVRDYMFDRWYSRSIPYPLAVSFSRLGLYDKAWRVQLEEGLSNGYTRGHSFYYENYHRTERDTEPFSFYLCAADNAYRAGNKKLAWEFLMSAAVFETDKTFEDAVTTAELWLDIEAGKKKLPEAKVLAGEERKNEFLRIANAYKEMGAHPRAWAFVQEYRKEFDHPDKFIKEIQDDWLDIVQMVTNRIFAAGKVVMFGTELYPAKNDPLSVKIPWACSDAAVAEFKKQLLKEAERMKEEEKGGFRLWYDIIEKKKCVKAKYESCINGEVTLIKLDGTKFKIPFTMLHRNDLNYVRQRYDLNYVRKRLDIERYHKAEEGEVIYPLRTWTSKNGTHTTEARYVSSTDSEVKLEKVDGEVITVKLSDLHHHDEYSVKRLKELQKERK